MSSFKFKVNFVAQSSGGPLVDVSVFAGKNKTSRQNTGGKLGLRIEEFEDLERVIGLGEAETGGFDAEFDRKILDEWLA